MILLLISIIIFVLVLIAGVLVVRKKPHLVEKLVTKLTVVGFCFQMMANWLFWGSGTSLNPMAVSTTPDKSSTVFLFLSLISIFCYAGLLALLFKAHDFYNGDKTQLS
ncbi:MAG: hypothetical protein Q4C68_05190 [Moraxella sp.]|nr:hypothetical protein [Moraxella sp.]